MPGGGPAGWSWLAAIRRYLVMSAVGHLLWEMAQLPLYTIWYDAAPQTLLFAVLHCLAGDMIIAAVALMAALAVLGSPRWPTERSLPVGAAVVGLGVAYVIHSEYLNTVVRQSWAYTRAMPVLPWIGTGIAPLAQWLVVPAVALLAAYRPNHFRHAARSRSPESRSS